MRIGLSVLFALGIALVVSIVGCAGGGGGNLPDPIIRFINSSPDANPLDFHVNDDIEASALAYLGDSGEVTVTNGDKDISIWDSVTQTEIDVIAFTMADDLKYVSLAVGLENFGVEFEKRLRVLAYQYNKNPPNGSRARLLITHAFVREPGFATPNIDFQNPGENPQFKVSDIEFGASTPSELEVDSGVPLIFQARRTGTENVYASDPGFTFDAGGIYVVLVTGIENAVGVQAPQIKYIKIN